MSQCTDYLAKNAPTFTAYVKRCSSEFDVNSVCSSTKACQWGGVSKDLEILASEMTKAKLCKPDLGTLLSFLDSNKVAADAATRLGKPGGYKCELAPPAAPPKSAPFGLMLKEYVRQAFEQQPIIAPIVVAVAVGAIGYGVYKISRGRK